MWVWNISIIAWAKSECVRFWENRTQHVGALSQTNKGRKRLQYYTLVNVRAIH